MGGGVYCIKPGDRELVEAYHAIRLSNLSFATSEPMSGAKDSFISNRPDEILHYSS